MQLITHTNPRILIPDEGKHIRSKNDVYTAEYVDEGGNVVPEHFPHYSTVIFPAVQIDTLEKAMEIYVEENID